MNAPLISVIIPAYKVEKYIDRTISSCQSQTLFEIEIIIVNDG
jgi:glycosyltransferase involved in cell wall biosynthesis